MINWEKLNKDDMELITKISDRAIKLFPQLNKLNLHMDISATHVSGCELDLDKLLDFDDFNFAHDVAGIVGHLDRKTGQLKDCFLPRCSA